MQKPMNGLWFRLMALEYSMKTDEDLQAHVLDDAGIRAGMTVVDFGCGPGRYTIPAARLVGAEGEIHAVDVHPLAIRMTERAAVVAGLKNIKTVRSDCATGIPSGSIDVVLLYDALHDVEDRDAVLGEIRRVLKSGGRIAYRDHSLQGEELRSLMRANGFSVSDESPTQTLFAKC